MIDYALWKNTTCILETEDSGIWFIGTGNEDIPFILRYLKEEEDDKDAAAEDLQETYFRHFVAPKEDWDDFGDNVWYSGYRKGKGAVHGYID